MKNMFVAILMALTSSVFAEEIPQNNTNYIATIDLTKVENDRVKVTIDVPEVSSETIVYCLPKIVPGTYSIYDFGRFIFEFNAYDKKAIN